MTTAAGLRTWRILEPLDALRRAAIGVGGFEPLDVVTEVGDEELRRTVTAAALEPIDGTHHRRLDALAGEALARRCIAEWARLAAAPRRPPEATAWRQAAASAASHTPAGESLLLRQAAATATASG